MNEIIIKKPISDNLEEIRAILAQWTSREEVDKYIKRIRNEIDGKIEFNGQYWVALENGVTVGIVGLSDLLPQLLTFTKTKHPGKYKILYVDSKHRGKSIGEKLVTFIEQEAKRQGYTEFLVRSAEQYRDTAYGFYKKMGYQEVGTVYAGEDRSKPMQVFRKFL